MRTGLPVRTAASATSAAKVLPCTSLPPNAPPMRGACTTMLLRGTPRTSETIAWISEGCCVEEQTNRVPFSPVSAQAA